jgi:hypothetical protein
MSLIQTTRASPGDQQRPTSPVEAGVADSAFQESVVKSMKKGRDGLGSVGVT